MTTNNTVTEESIMLLYAEIEEIKIEKDPCIRETLCVYPKLSEYLKRYLTEFCSLRSVSFLRVGAANQVSAIPF